MLGSGRGKEGGLCDVFEMMKRLGRGKRQSVFQKRTLSNEGNSGVTVSFNRTGRVLGV